MAAPSPDQKREAGGSYGGSGDSLRGRSLAELGEMLRRQERLLAERNFISRLPDKGQKIVDFAEKLKAAIAQEEELRRTARLLSAIRLEFQQKQEGIASGKRGTILGSNSNSAFENPCLIVEPSSAGIRSKVESAPQDNRSTLIRERSTKNKTKLSEQTMEVSHIPQGNLETRHQGDLPKGPEDQPANAAQSANRTGQVISDAFERLSIAENESDRKPEKGQMVQSNSNPFQNLPNLPRRPPHYIEVLEQRAMNPVTKRSRFKTNALFTESSGSSHGSPDVPSPGGLSSISAEERRCRNKKHLDDITAAWLPPLYHQPSQLISIGESIAIQVQQKETYEEMQAKLTAQRLAKKLGIKIVHYEPEGETAASYREVRDKEGYSSAED